MATSCNDGTFPLEYDDCVYSNSDETIQLRVKNQEDGKYIDLSGGENWLTIKCQQKYSADVVKEYLGSAEPPTPDGFGTKFNRSTFVEDFLTSSTGLDITAPFIGT